MATVTPNYSWPVPTSTDLVKDGATGIEALGDAIDATVFALPSPLDIVLSSGTFTTVSAVNISSALSSTYNFYKLYLFAKGSVGNATLSLRFRENTTDFTGSNYVTASQNYTTAGTPGNYSSGATAAQVQLAQLSTTLSSTSRIDLTRVSAAEGSLTYQSYDANNSTGIHGMARNSTVTNFNGLSFYPASGTFTGYYILTGRKV
jgi:hypothetical protein